MYNLCFHGVRRRFRTILTSFILAAMCSSSYTHPQPGRTPAGIVTSGLLHHYSQDYLVCVLPRKENGYRSWRRCALLMKTNFLARFHGQISPCWCTSRWAPAWCLHTNLYKFGKNVSPHIFRKKNCCDPNLGESICISTFFVFPDSGLNLLNGFDFLFDLFWIAWHWKPALIMIHFFICH